jgi:hypothetical protein
MADVELLRWAQLLNRLVDLDESLYGGDGIEYYLDYILFNSVASTIPKWPWMKCCMTVMTLKVTLIPYYFVS